MNALEPWRYRCPECGSVSVRRRLDLSGAKEVVADKRTATRNTTPKKFYCNNCQTALERLLDAKLESEVASV